MKAIIAAVLVISSAPQAIGGSFISSSQFTTANPELLASTSQMVSNLAAIYFKYKCDDKKKLDEQIKCTIVGQTAGLLSSTDKKGEAVQSPSGPLNVSRTFNALMASYVSEEERKDYSYKDFINPLKEEFESTSENELVETSISVLAATMYGGQAE